MHIQIVTYHFGLKIMTDWKLRTCGCYERGAAKRSPIEALNSINTTKGAHAHNDGEHSRGVYAKRKANKIAHSGSFVARGSVLVLAAMWKYPKGKHRLVNGHGKMEGARETVSPPALRVDVCANKLRRPMNSTVNSTHYTFFDDSIVLA